METIISTNARIECTSTGILTDKKGRLVLGKKGDKIVCHPRVAEKYERNGWIEPVGKEDKKADQAKGKK